ncbi:MAG: hypothetical protein ACE5E6_03195 [Phycisphaerae bacterium]
MVLALAGIAALPAAVSAGSGPAAGVDRPEILSVIPEDAAAAVWIRDLGALDGKLGGLLGKLDLPPVSPLLMAKGWLTMVDGLDDGGSAAVVVLPESAGATGTASRRSVVLLLPTTNRTALLALLAPEPVEPGYTRVTLRGRPALAASKGSYTVFGPDMAAVKRVVASRRGVGATLSAHQRRRFKTDDLAVWINPRRDGAGGLFDFVAAMAGRIGIDREALARQKSVQLSLRLDPAGVAMHLYRERPAGAAERMESSAPGSLLLGLPRGRFALAMGVALTDGAGPERAARRLVAGALPVAVAIKPGRIDQVADVVGQLVAKVGGVAVVVAPLPEDDGGLLAITVIVTLRDGATAVSDDIDAVVQLLRSAPFVDSTLNAAFSRLMHRRGAETTGGVSIDQIALDASGLEATDAAILKRVAGSEGLSVRVGVVKARYLVATLGGGVARFDEAVTVVRSGAAPLASDAGILRVAERLPAQRWVEAYAHVDVLARLGADVARVVAGATVGPWDLPALEAPVALGVHRVLPAGDELSVFVPVEVIEAVVSAGMAAVSP